MIFQECNHAPSEEEEDLLRQSNKKVQAGEAPIKVVCV